jgi:hypothetical protein
LLSGLKEEKKVALRAFVPFYRVIREKKNNSKRNIIIIEILIDQRN